MQYRGVLNLWSSLTVKIPVCLYCNKNKKITAEIHHKCLRKLSLQETPRGQTVPILQSEGALKNHWTPGVLKLFLRWQGDSATTLEKFNKTIFSLCSSPLQTSRQCIYLEVAFITNLCLWPRTCAGNNTLHTIAVLLLVKTLSHLRWSQYQVKTLAKRSVTSSKVFFGWALNLILAWNALFLEESKQLLCMLLSQEVTNPGRRQSFPVYP